MEGLIRDEVEEHLQLEYKAAAALDKSDKKKDEISKDVSALANAAGGTLIYGLKEGERAKKHLVEKIDWITDPAITKEWLENIILSRIHPRLPGLEIAALRAESGTVFVVEVPQSMTVHQAHDKRYYKRHNFSSVPMEDYEIRDVMNRQLKPVVEIEALVITSPFLWEGESWLYKRLARIPALKELNGHRFETKNALILRVANTGRVRANNVRVDVTFPTDVLYDGKKLVKRLENTVSDHPAKGYGVSEQIGAKRYSPVFPDGYFEFETSFKLNKDLQAIGQEEIEFVVYADDASPRKLSIPVGEIPVRRRPRGRIRFTNGYDR